MDNKETVDGFQDIVEEKEKLWIGSGLGIGYITGIIVVFAYFVLMAIFKPAPESSEAMMLSIEAQFITAIILIIVMGFIIRNKLKVIIRDLFRDKTIAYALTLIVAMYFFNYIYSYICEFIFKVDTTTSNQAVVDSIFVNSPVLAFFFVALVAPLIEELIYRYFFFNAIRRKNAVLAIVITTLLFAASHLMTSIGTEDFAKDMVLFPFYLVPSFLLTMVYYKTKHFAVPVLAHIGYNGFSAILTLLLQWFVENGDFASSLAQFFQ